MSRALGFSPYGVAGADDVAVGVLLCVGVGVPLGVGVGVVLLGVAVGVLLCVAVGVCAAVVAVVTGGWIGWTSPEALLRLRLPPGRLPGDSGYRPFWCSASKALRSAVISASAARSGASRASRSAGRRVTSRVAASGSARSGGPFCLPRT